jgi:DNA-binding LacI/PurR family transcriptional regulator
VGNPVTSKKPTLATVAETVGVSRMTVSNAYNRPDQLSPALRERILAAAGELGYQGPDPVARGLSRGRTGSIGLVFDHPLTHAFTDPAAVLFLHGVAAGCEARGVGLSLVPRVANGDQLVRTALVDGFVVYCPDESLDAIGFVAARELPYVLVDEAPGTADRQLNVEDRAGARAAAAHLVALGHRRFGVLLSPASRREATAAAAEAGSVCFVDRERLTGWREALTASGVDWDAVPAAYTDADTEEAAARSAGTLLDRKPRPSALLCFSDVLAMGALAAARDRGIDIPRELSVVGFDDVPAAARAQPPLTTVRQPHYEKGERAVAMLLDPDSSQARLPTELVVRASTAPAP